MQLSYVIFVHLALGCLSLAMATQLYREEAMATIHSTRNHGPTTENKLQTSDKKKDETPEPPQPPQAHVPGVAEIFRCEGVPALVLTCFLVSFG